MPLSTDICVRCNKPVKSPVTCGTCGQLFHLSCARDFIRNKSLTCCCRTKLGYLLKSLQVSGTTEQTVRSRINSFRAAKLSTSSVSSYKSLPDSPLENSPLQSPKTPFMMSNPTDVFSPPNPTSTSAVLPEDWEKKSFDEKMTALMLKFLTSDSIVNKELKDLGTKVADLQEAQKSAAEELSKVKNNVIVQAESIAQLNSDLGNVKEAHKNDVNLLNQKLSDLSKSVHSDNHSSIPAKSIAPSITSELVISGVPDSVAQKLSLSEIFTAVLTALKLPNLVIDNLNIRKFENKKRHAQVQDNIRLNSYIVSFKSHQVRNFVINSKRKLKNLQANAIFPAHVDPNYGGAIYINEFLPTETYRLLLQTKEEAKQKRFKYVWVTNGRIFAKKDDVSDKFVISSELDLNQLN